MGILSNLTDVGSIYQAGKGNADQSDGFKAFARRSPAQANYWLVRLPDLAENIKQIRGGSGLTLAQRLMPDLRKVQDCVSSVTTPSPNFTTEHNHNGNSNWKSATKHDVGALAIEFLEYEDGIIRRYLEAWKARMVNQDAHSITNNPPALYKLPIEVIRLDTTHNQYIREKYIGCFPTNVADITTNYESSDLLKYTVSFACDAVQVEIIDSSKEHEQISEAMQISTAAPSSYLGL